MLELQDIENEVLSLPKGKYSEFRKWFFSYDFELWDRDIETDSNAGKLDFLIEEAVKEEKSDELKPL